MLSFTRTHSIRLSRFLTEVARTPFLATSRYIPGTHFHTRRKCFDSSSEFHCLHSARPAPIKYALPPTRHLPKPFIATRTGKAYFGDLIPGYERLPYDRRWIVLRRSYSSLGQVLKFFGLSLILVCGGLLPSIPSTQPTLEMFIAAYRVKYLTIREKHLEGKIGPTSCECARLQPEERQKQLEELRALIPHYVQELE